MSTVITEGKIERQNRENDWKAKQEEIKINKIQKQLQDKKILNAKSLFKKTIYDSFINVFSNNYGETFDYNSLINSIKFDFKIEKNGDLLPNYTFNENTVVFKSDAESENQKFNENSYSYFISNEDEIEGKHLDNFIFDNSEEYELYEENEIDSSDLDNYDGSFIPVSDNKKRYGDFNKINKTLGYTPTGESRNEAAQQAKLFWEKLSKKRNL